MKNGIKELQQAAMWFIWANHLSEEYENYWACCKGITGHIEIDFVIDYCQKHADEIFELEQQELDNVIDDTILKLSDNVCAEIKQALEQEPNKGHWIPKIIRGDESYICSECSAECCYIPTSYCPNCGIRMIEIEVKNDN